MAVLKKKQAYDHLTEAVSRSAQATNLFTAAATQLEESNDLLAHAIANDLSQISALQARVELAQRQEDSNKAVASKLQEFVTV